jgi:DNA-binding response OmpR family regulator
MERTRILCVDDDVELLDRLSNSLVDAGFSVILASTGFDALALAYSQKPDLILLDLRLPDITGEEICHRLRAHSPTAKMPIIMLTVKADEADKVLGLEIGADDYVTKPYSEKILLARIRALLRRRGGQNY